MLHISYYMQFLNNQNITLVIFTLHNITLDQYKQMKSIKIKFHNKRKKLRTQTQTETDQLQHNYKNKNKQHNHQTIGFLLKQNTDTQQAKHQLRKVSQQVYQNISNQGNCFSWNHDNIGIPICWLDEMKSKSRNIISNSNVGEGKGSKNGENLKNCFSYEELKTRSQIKGLVYQNMQKFVGYKKSYLASIVRKQKINDDNPGQNQAQISNIKNNIDQNTQQKARQSPQYKLRYKNKSANQFKKRSRISANYSKPDNKQQQDLKNIQQKNAGVSTTYFKVPDFNKTNIKRSTTVHSESNSSQVNIKKTNFYLKKTKTICILQKPFDETNKCISLSNYNYHRLNTKKNKLASQQIQKSKQRLKDKTQNLHTLQKSCQNLKANVNKLHLQQTAKTMMLRQEFQRLRKLLKKQYKSQFKVDNDLPIKILKL